MTARVTGKLTAPAADNHYPCKNAECVTTAFFDVASGEWVCYNHREKGAK